MQAHLILQRDQIMARLWAVEDSGVPEDSRELFDAAQTATHDMTLLVRKLDDSAHPLQAGRSWKYLGDTFYTRAAKKDQECLEQACEAYLTAETLLEQAGDQIELAKLNFNLANSLRLTDEGMNRVNMEEAKRRYFRALQLFQQFMPAGVARVESSIKSLEVALRALGVYEKEKELRDEGRDILAQRDDPDPAVTRRAAAFLEREDPRVEIRGFRALVEEGGAILASLGGRNEKSGTMVKELDKMFGQLPTRMQEEPADVKRYRRIVEHLLAGVEHASLSQVRKEALKTFRQEFEAIAAQRADTEFEERARTKRMTDLIDRYKAILIGP